MMIAEVQGKKTKILNTKHIKNLKKYFVINDLPISLYAVGKIMILAPQESRFAAFPLNNFYNLQSNKIVQNELHLYLIQYHPSFILMHE